MGNPGLPMYMQYVNAGFEICIPALIILFVARQHPAYNVLQSPAQSVYFIFIILSTLRLNFSISFFCGVLAAAWNFITSYFIYGHFTSTDAGRVLIFLLGGVAAGMVARQIRNGIDNSLTETEKQHKLINLFGKQVSKEVAEKVLENNGSIESKRMHVAIMFIDIRNFTRFVVGKTPEEIVQYQNDFFSIVVDAVEKQHGIVNQFLGDGCMVTFGAPHPLDNPSRCAVTAAMDILHCVEADANNAMLSPTRIGIGIHAGEVVTGNIGTTHRQQYSITGNVVILASRLEQLNKMHNSQVLVSKEVFTAADCRLETECLGPVAIKGWNECMEVYKLA